MTAIHRTKARSKAARRAKRQEESAAVAAQHPHAGSRAVAAE